MLNTLGANMATGVQHAPHKTPAITSMALYGGLLQHYTTARAKHGQGQRRPGPSGPQGGARTLAGPALAPLFLAG